MTKQQVISAVVLASIQAHGGDVKKGFDAIFGEGAFSKMASEVYHTLRAK